MAGEVTVNQVQLGDSGTATQNFVWQTNADGTCKLARGNVGATTQDILTVDANGKVLLPQSYPAMFRAYATAAQSLPHATWTKVNFPTEEFDTDSLFASSRFTATMAGYYHFVAGVELITNAYFGIAFRKNGAEYVVGTLGNSLQMAHGSALIPLNATDYVEVFCYQSFGSAQNTIAGASVTYFSGQFLRPL